MDVCRELYLIFSLFGNPHVSKYVLKKTVAERCPGFALVGKKKKNDGNDSACNATFNPKIPRMETTAYAMPHSLHPGLVALPLIKDFVFGKSKTSLVIFPVPKRWMAGKGSWH